MESIKLLQVDIMPETFPSRLTCAEIIEDLKKHFNPEDEYVKGADMQQLLVYLAEQMVEPVGWQAMWRCDPRGSQFVKSNLNSPSLVEVLNVDYNSLEAIVQVLDSSENQVETVPLIELYPLKDQENDAINVDATHNTIQRIRFFKHHLLLPWDIDGHENWFDVHLPERVQMFCDLRSGFLSQEVAVRYHYLLSEAYDVEKKLQQLEEKVKDSEDEAEEEDVAKITELNSKLEQIQQDIEIILNPSTRMLLFGSKITRVKSNDHADILLVVQGQSCYSLHQALNELEKQYSPELAVRCYPSLQTALDDARSDDVIAITKGIHSMLNINSFRHGGTLIGVGPKEDVVVHLGCNTEVGLPLDEGAVTIKNCTVLVNNRQSGISLKGQLVMEACVIRGASPVTSSESDEEKSASSWKGLYVATHSQLVLKSCTITNFDVGIRIRVGGQADVSDSSITSCNIGILAEQNSRIQIHNSEFSKCNEHAIGIEMDPELVGETVVGDVELLDAVKETVQLEECVFTGNLENVKLEY